MIILYTYSYTCVSGYGVSVCIPGTSRRGPWFNIPATENDD